MLKSFRNLPSLTLIVALTALNLVATQVAWGLSISRIIPTGQVKVYQGDQVVQVLSEEAPFPEGLMLENEGQCGVRLDNFYMVATDQSRFGILDTAGKRHLIIEQGTTYFALSSIPGQLVFVTPAGEFPAVNILINASSNGPLLKGYVAVTGEKTEIGVIDGGAMEVSVLEGVRRIESNQQITIAQAPIYAENGERQQQVQGEQSEDDDDDEDKGGVPPWWKTTGGQVGIAAVSAAMIAGAVVLATGSDGGGGGGGGGGDSVSPIN